MASLADCLTKAVKAKFSTRAVFDIANRQKQPDVSASVRLNLFYYNDRNSSRSHLRWEVTWESG